MRSVSDRSLLDLLSAWCCSVADPINVLETVAASSDSGWRFSLRVYLEERGSSLQEFFDKVGADLQRVQEQQRSDASSIEIQQRLLNPTSKARSDNGV